MIKIHFYHFFNELIVINIPKLKGEVLGCMVMCKSK
jgi:hypothetical protein